MLKRMDEMRAKTRRYGLGSRVGLSSLGGLLGIAAVVGSMALTSSALARGKAGDYDYLSLVLSWSPTYCSDRRSGRKELQCSRKRGYAFVLHGLWPQYNRGYPSNCRRGGWVPKDVIAKMMDIMPSKKLVIHEYKKHGTCMLGDVNRYYKVSRDLFKKVVIPKRFQNPAQPFTTSVRDVRSAFVKANPRLRPDMLGVVCTRRGAKLKEVRICFTKKGEFTRCGSNETQNRLCRARQLRVLSVRQGGGFRPIPKSGARPERRIPYTPRPRVKGTRPVSN